MEDDHSDTETSQILGDWDPPPPPTKGTVVGGRVLPPWADPSYEWGGGKWKEDARKKRKKENNDLMSLEDLMKEYASLPPQIAEWFWCIEYVAKFHNLPLPCLLDLMNMGYPPTNDYGSRINELLSLRILESLFVPTMNDDATVFGPRIEFDCSLSSTHVLNAILKKHIPVSELRPGLPELSNFNALPFIAHKNMSLPQTALEKLRDLWAMENNRTSSAPTVEVNDHSVYYRDDDQPEQRDADDGVETNEVVVIDGNDTTAEQQSINNNGDTTRETSSSPSSELRVQCTKDGAWLMCGSDDDESDMVPPPRPQNVCWKCERGEGGGLLLICSRSECAAKVHKECLNCQARFDEEDDSFHCPVCWYDRMAMEYHESHKLMSGAKGRLVKFLPLLARASKRLRR